MKYFIDTEFIEGSQSTLFGKTKPTIDLISIGIVSEDGREYYAISKEFNIKKAWNSYQIEEKTFNVGFGYNTITEKTKIHWLRENVLRPIFDELYRKYLKTPYGDKKYGYHTIYIKPERFNYNNLKYLIKRYGKTNKQIAEEVIEFCKGKINERNDEFREFVYSKDDINKENPQPAYGYFENRTNPEFYGYYSDYDWVVFCWLFGKMIDLPKGFPMHCIDLKQMLDEKANTLTSFELSKLAHSDIVTHNVYSTYDTGVLKCSKTDLLKNALNYPKQINEHNALADAKWNYELYKFLNNQF